VSNKRTLAEFKKNAVLFWPREILERASAASVLPLLLKTQEKFISVLNLSDSAPDSWKKLVDISAELKGNLFLKHLMVLSDLGGETLNKLPPLSNYFKKGKMTYIWREKKYIYQFKAIHKKVPLANAALRADGKGLLKGYALEERMEDVIMLLLHGASSIGDTLPDEVKNKCVIGTLMGEPKELDKFVKQNYIRISRQLGGATSNALGQLAQDFVIEKLKERLPDWKFKRNGTMPGVSHTGGETETTFDVVATSPNNKYIGIEVSFQVTTNSVIERKAGQAEGRAHMVHRAGHCLCYVIDGAGNINIREAATSTINKYSDYTAALSNSEMSLLAEFMLKHASS
jgi:hypothetical protein